MGREKDGRTLLDALPHPVLFCLTQTGHALRVAPPQEIGLFQLTHECLLARLSARRQEQPIGGRRGQMEREAQRNGLRATGGGCPWTRSSQGCVIVVNKPNGPVPARPS